MEFELNVEQKAIRDTVHRFTEQEVAPHASEWDEQNYFPRDIFQQLAALGLWGLSVPEDYGGSPLDRLSGALVYEELARGDMATAVGLGVHNMVSGIVARYGTEEQRQHYLPALAQGRLFGAFSLSEAGSGSDAANLQCRAEPQSDGTTYRINGSKLWVTNGGEADLYLLLARTSEGHSSAGISCFLLEKGLPGFSFGKLERKMGLHSSPTRELLFEDCFVPATLRVGEEGKGFKIALASLDGGRINVAAIAVGVGQAALDLASTYAQQRTQFGKEIATFQGIQFMLADMAMKLEAARMLTYEAAWRMEHDLMDRPYASMAKCFATDTAMEITTNAVQILGGAGYTRDFPAERYMRDIKVAQIFEGTNQVQRMIIARNLLHTLRDR